MNHEPSSASDLFSEDLRSYPPRIVELRRFYDEAKAAYEAADAHEDESGEEIPRVIRMDYHHWERQLRIEEARVASENVSDQMPRTQDVADTTDSPERLSASDLFAPCDGCANIETCRAIGCIGKELEETI